jgi:pimeloyl-ACP methyl ester carboxylesterase
VISLPDGRQLGYFTVGEGKPVVYFHGTASSRLENLLLKELAHTAQLQIIGMDRVGYGLSTFTPRKSLVDFNGDVTFLTNHLRVKRFGILGWSGGGVFALTYTAFFPERVTRAVIVSTPALPFDVAAAHNNPFARFAMKLPFLGLLAVKKMSVNVLKANDNIGAFLESREGKQILNSCSEDDLKFFSNTAWATLMYNSMREAFRRRNEGVKAVFQEHQLFMKPWNINFSRIPADNLFIWHGADDKTCRVSNAYMISGQNSQFQLANVFYELLLMDY